MDSGGREVVTGAMTYLHAINHSKGAYTILLDPSNYISELATASSDAPLRASRQHSVPLKAINGTFSSIMRDLIILDEMTNGGTTATVVIPASQTWCGLPRTISQETYRNLTCAGRDAYPFDSCDGVEDYFAIRGWWVESLADRRPATIFLTFSQEHLKFLINTRKRLLIFALFIKSWSARILAHTYHFVYSALAIIAVFMSHRHRHEPADGWLLSRTSIQSLAGCSSR